MERIAETKLVELSKWAIYSLIVPGFFPFRRESIYDDGRSYVLTFDHLSPEVFYVILVLFTNISWNALFYIRQASIAKYLNAGGPTELYAYNISIGFASILGIYYGGFFLFCHESVLKLWKETAELFEHLSRLPVPSSLLLKPEGQEKYYFLEQPWFRAVNSSMREGFFFLIIPTIVVLFVTYGYQLMAAAEDHDMTTEDLQTTITIGIWSFFSMTGSGISCWLALFIQVYGASFKTVVESLKSLSSKPEKRSSYLIKSKDFYSDELLNLKNNSGTRNPWVITSSKKLKHREEPLDDPSWVEQEIEKNLEVYKEIESILEEFNELYGYIMVVEMAFVVVNLLIYIFFELIWLSKSSWVLLIQGLVPIYILAKEIFDLGSISEDLTASAEQVVKTVVGNLPIETLSSQMQLKVSCQSKYAFDSTVFKLNV
jgi:hypothetical protein